MSAYLIVNEDIKDSAGYEEYRKVAAPIVEGYGGPFVVRGGAHEVLEGDWNPARLVVVEFDCVEQAKRLYESAEYQGPKSIRHRAARTDMVLVQGV